MEAFDILIDDFDEPTSGGAASSRRCRPLGKMGRSVEGGEGDNCLMSSDLMERRNKGQEGGDAVLKKRVNNLIDTWRQAVQDGGCS